MKVYQHCGMTGDVKLMAGLTLENIGDSLIAAKIISENELNDLLRKLKSYARHDNTLMSLPRIVQTWGHA